MRACVPHTSRSCAHIDTGPCTCMTGMGMHCDAVLSHSAYARRQRARSNTSMQKKTVACTCGALIEKHKTNHAFYKKNDIQPRLCVFLFPFFEICDRNRPCPPHADAGQKACLVSNSPSYTSTGICVPRKRHSSTFQWHRLARRCACMHSRTCT